MSKAECLRTDHWQTVSTFLTVRELCRLMCVSRAWFHRWVDDRLWSHQRQRICTQFPDLAALFDEYRPSKESKKRYKQEWCMPRKGVWRVFKSVLHKACTMSGIKELCKKKLTHPLVLAVCRLNVPCAELIYDSRVVEYENRNRKNVVLYGVSFWWKAGRYPGHRASFYVRHSCDEFGFEFYDIDLNEFYTTRNGRIHNLLRHDEFLLTWECFLFQDPHATVWRSVFEQLIQASARRV